MKLAKTFEIISQKIRVQYVDDLVMTHDALGQSRFAQNLILIQANTKTFKVTKESQEHTYYHEMAHFVLYYMGEMELCHNEKFVDLLGNILLQIDKTKKYS